MQFKWNPRSIFNKVAINLVDPKQAWNDFKKNLKEQLEEKYKFKRTHAKPNSLEPLERTIKKCKWQVHNKMQKKLNK